MLEEDHLRLFLVVITIVCIIMTPITYNNVNRMQQDYNEVLTWSSTEAMVIEASVDANVTTSVDESCTTSSQGSVSCSTETKLSTAVGDISFRYNFTVDSITYKSSTYNFCGDEPSTTFVEEHPVGSTLTIYYNPDFPPESLVTRSDHSCISWQKFQLYVFSIVAVGGISLGVYIIFNNRDKNTNLV